MRRSDQPKPKRSTAAGESNSAEMGHKQSPDGIEEIGTSIGSGLLARQPTPEPDEHVTVAKVCPQCGVEYETGDRFCPKDGAPLKPKSGGDPMIGRVIADRYLILARLGEGGMGRVYAAEHVKMNRQCAIKVMNPSLMNDAESTARFAREASNAARILHPNVAAVFDFGESDRTVYLVMEYVDGEPLSDILAREGALQPRRAIDIARQIADGLSAAHELGLIHRDLKPDNVIVTRKRDGKEIAKVVDFGIAKAVSDSPQDALTRSGLVIGTPEFMSPEQLLGDPVDQRTDIYALGCMLYQMLSGAKPFDADSREQMIRRRLHEPPPHIREIVPSIPKRVDTLIAHMLARSTADRLASAAEVSTSLDPALVMSGWDVGSISAPVTIRSGRGAPTMTQEAADLGMQPTMVLKIGRRSAGRVAVGAFLGSMALFGGMYLWRQRQPAGPMTPSAAAATTDTTRPVATSVPTPNETVRSSRQGPADSASQVAVGSPTSKKPVGKRDTARVPGGANVSSVSGVSSAAAKPPATKPAPVTTPVAPSASPDEMAIHDALERFSVAMGNGEVSMRNAFPGIPAPILDNLKMIFAQSDKVTARSSQGDPSINGDRAEVPFAVQIQYQRRNSPVVETYKQNYTATLTKQRNGTQWELTGLAIRN
jgi:eukaryotic-like serine/threonine-protein kinase